MRLLDRAKSALGLTPHVAADSAQANALAAAPRYLGAGTGILSNLLSGMNTSDDQAWWDVWFARRTLSNEQRKALAADPLVRRILSLPGEDATQQGWTPKITAEHPEHTAEQISKKIEDYEDRAEIDLQSKLCDLSLRSRAFGDALILLGIDDGRPPDQPVDVARIKRVWWAAVIDRRDFEYGKVIGPRGEVGDYRYLTPEEQAKYAPGAQLFGQVRTFRITDLNGVLPDGIRYGDGLNSGPAETMIAAGAQFEIHADRVLHLPYDRALPLTDQLQDALAAYFRGMSGISRAIDRASLFVWKVANHIAQSWSENHHIGEKRIRSAMKSWSALSAVVLDSKEEDLQPLGSGSTAGLEGAIHPIMLWLCAVSGIPSTRLFGMSPGGFGTGEREGRDYDSLLGAVQARLTPLIRKFDRYALAAQDGLGLVVDAGQIDVQWCDLHPPTAAEKAEKDSKNATTAVALVGAGLYLPSEMRALFDFELDAEARKRLAVAALENQQTNGRISGETFAAILNLAKETGIQKAFQPAAARALIVASGVSHLLAAQIFPDPPPEPTPAPVLAPATPPAPGAPETPETADGQGGDPVADAPPPPSRYIPDDALPAKELAPVLGIPSRTLSRMYERGEIRQYIRLNGQRVYSRAEVLAAEEALNLTPEERAEREAELAAELEATEAEESEGSEA